MSQSLKTKAFKVASICASALTALAATAPASFAADTLEIRNFIGTINWSNGAMSAEVEKNAGETEITGRRSLIIDGGQSGIEGSNCKSSYGGYDISWFGTRKQGNFGGYENLEDFPVLNISVPEDTALLIRDSIIFTHGSPNVAEAEFDLRYCGNITLGDVQNTLALNSGGSADLTVGRTGQIAASLSGSGDLLGGNSGDVLIESRGSGDIELGDLASVELNLMGSGDFDASDVDGSVEITSRGSGDSALGKVQGNLVYASLGSGDFSATKSNGESLDLKSHGSGDIDVAGGRVQKLQITSYGSGNIDFSGEAATANLSSVGSGDIDVDRVTGTAETKNSGSGDIDIKSRD